MPLTMHMIHPRVSLLTSATSMIGCQSPLALSLDTSVVLLRSGACSSWGS